VAERAARYMLSLPARLARQADTLLFDYESTGDETYFRDEPASALLARLAVQAAEPPPARAAAAAKRSAAPTRARRGGRRLDEWCQQ
jgi:hypothetical protein